jgi:sugar lactone lactonase YvrE
MKTRLLLLLAFALPLFAHPPVSVVVDAQGNAYYSDLAQVWKVAPNGTKTVAVPGVHTHELYLDPRGNLYGEHLWYEGEATDKWGYYVWRRSPDGRVSKVIPNREGFRTTYSFVRDGAGNMYWANRDKQRVERVAPDGKVTVVASNLKNVRWMTAETDGTLHLIDGADLVRVSPRGAATGVATGVAKKVATPSIFRLQIGTQHAVMGLWTDRAGNVYAAAYANGKVKKITRDGTMTVFLESPAGWSPVGGAFAPNGDLLLLEWSPTNKARLRRWPESRIRLR